MCAAWQVSNGLLFTFWTNGFDNSIITASKLASANDSWAGRTVTLAGVATPDWVKMTGTSNRTRKLNENRYASSELPLTHNFKYFWAFLLVSIEDKTEWRTVAGPCNSNSVGMRWITFATNTTRIDGHGVASPGNASSAPLRLSSLLANFQHLNNTSLWEGDLYLAC